MRKQSLLFFLLLLCFSTFAQRQKADSLNRLLQTETRDTARVRLMWNIAGAVNIFSPDSAQQIAQEALTLARKIHDIEGQSRAMGVLANSLRSIGNYPRALELNLQKLKIEEKRNKPRNLGSVLMNIGAVYVDQEEYRKALYYYDQSDSVIQKFNVEEIKYFVFLVKGDAYNRLNISDSALLYFNRSLELAREKKDGDLIGASMTGLGHSYLKLGSLRQSLLNYRMAIQYLTAANDDETYCEASLGLANLFRHLNMDDSSAYYATASMSVAHKDGYLKKELEAADFLADHYKNTKNIDSAFAYLNIVHTLDDSVNSRTRVRESQVISSNEQFRQLELEENSRIAAEERKQQLQMLLIGMFIPGLFLLTLLLSRVKLHVQAIRLLGVLSLLFFFEYLTLLLHPRVERLTHHTPVYEIMIFVAIAFFLIPAHHKLEHWVIHKLLHHRLPHNEKEKEKEQA